MPSASIPRFYESYTWARVQKSANKSDPEGGRERKREKCEKACISYGNHFPLAPSALEELLLAKVARREGGEDGLLSSIDARKFRWVRKRNRSRSHYFPCAPVREPKCEPRVVMNNGQSLAGRQKLNCLLLHFFSSPFSQPLYCPVGGKNDHSRLEWFVRNQWSLECRMR